MEAAHTKHIPVLNVQSVQENRLTQVVVLGRELCTYQWYHGCCLGGIRLHDLLGKRAHHLVGGLRDLISQI